MTRSLKKGPFIDENLLKKIQGTKPLGKAAVNTWSRRAVITPEMVGFTFGVYNGKQFIPVLATEDMVGHKLGEFSPTTKFIRHGGRMQKEIEQGAAAAAGAVSAPASAGATAGEAGKAAKPAAK
ncbi:MAG: 30S ribosomal protein S19 [Candidatus Wildermuthbacteria bacterium]|nr:30S ribosomal protein S19 [Candidatus Wildermuthbacteria bacterium]